jgi:hypothetical protein
MTEITSGNELKAAILQLEGRQAEQELKLRVQYEVTYKSLNPMNILKKSFKDTFSSNEKEEGAIDYFANFIGDFASKQILKGTSNTTVKEYLSPIIQVIIVTIIKQNSEFFQAFGTSIISALSAQDKETDTE